MPEPGTPGPPDPTSGRDRLVRAFLRPSRGQGIVAVLLALLAFAGITQVRSNDLDEGRFAGYREQELIDVLTGLSGTSQRAQAEIDRLEETRDQLRSANNRRESALGQARTEIESLRILAGLVPVTGPGLRITIREGDQHIDAVTLLDMVQELRTAGAEAMQVNGQVRLVAQSAFEDGLAGGVVVDGEQLAAPYVLDVIGDASSLESALTFPLGPRYEVEVLRGGTLELEEVRSLDIETVRRPGEPMFAEPRPGQ